MTFVLSIVLALSAGASAGKTAEVSKTVKEAPTPSQAISALLSRQPPKGWNSEEYANAGGADPVEAFSDGVDRITIRAFGGPGSAYKKPAGFLAGAAASTMGRKPESVGSATVAGRRLTVYKRGFPINLGDPHAPSGPPMLGKEFFCVLPVSGGRFVVLSYARESPAPDLERRGEEAWEAFLRTVKLPGRKT